MCYSPGDESWELDLENQKEMGRSIVDLPISLTGLAFELMGLRKWGTAGFRSLDKETSEEKEIKRVRFVGCIGAMEMGEGTEQVFCCT